MISHNLSFIQNGIATQSSVDDLHLFFMMRDYTNHQLDTLTIPSSNLVSITTLQVKVPSVVYKSTNYTIRFHVTHNLNQSHSPYPTTLLIHNQTVMP